MNPVRLIAILLFCSFLSCQKNVNDQATQVTYDPDAQRFIDSASLTNNTQELALNDFVTQLKAQGFWTKFKAIYPMLGGSESSMKWNLLDPRNLDVAFRLTFHGSPLCSGSGVLFQTSPDYADSHLTDSMLVYNDNSISYYSVTQNTVSGYDMGCFDHGSAYNELAIYHSSDASNWFGYYNFGPKPVNTKGLFMFSATASDVTRFENGAIKNSLGTPPVPGATGYKIVIGGVAGASSGGMRECALATIGSGLTDAEALAFYNIVKIFENERGN